MPPRAMTYETSTCRLLPAAYHLRSAVRRPPSTTKNHAIYQMLRANDILLLRVVLNVRSGECSRFLMNLCPLNLCRLKPG
jgi:hypothetical protein